MTIVDIVIIIVGLVSVLIGFIRGIVRESVAIAGLLLAIWAAMRLGPYAGGWLGGTLDSTELQLWAGRILVFVVVFALGAVIGFTMSKLVRMSGLTSTDRALGSFFGFIRAVLLVGLFVLGGRYAGVDGEGWWLRSQLIPYAEEVADWIDVMAPKGVELLQPDQLGDEFDLDFPDSD